MMHLLERKLLVVGLIALSITLTLQGWVGSATIYAPGLRAKRDGAHAAIITNTSPDPRGWHHAGMRGNAIRVGVPFGIEWLARFTGRTPSTLYRMLDTLMLPILLVSLWLLLRAHASDTEALIVMLLIAAALPLTYQLHYFHPWDRVSGVLWLGTIWLIRGRRPWLLAMLLPLGVLVKYDLALVFGLYWLSHVDRHRWRYVSIESLMLAAVGLGTYNALRWWRPNSFEAGYHVSERVAINLAEFLSQPVIWPPLLFFGPICILAAYGWRRASAFERAGVVFAGGFLLLALLTINLAEVRALMPAMLALAPCGSRGVGRLFEPWSQGKAPGGPLDDATPG
jgi:hypothetical protein